MSDFSSDYEDSDNWLLDLETALLENCDYFKLRSICQHRPVPSHLRSDVWKICLNIQKNVDALESFNDVFDLVNQDLLHEHCREFVASLPKEFYSNSIGFISDIESILTHFSRVYRVAYKEGNGWLSILHVLCCELRLTDRRELYAFFTAICHRFLPSASVMDNGDIFIVFRLLIQYHEPELSSFLDTHRISGDIFAYDWFSSLLSSQLPQEVLVQLWDIMFLDSDPFLTMYLSLVVMLNLRESLFELRGADRSLIVNKIRAVLPHLTNDDLEDFYKLAQHHVFLTPRSLAVKFSPILFGNAHKDKETQCLLDSLCMPISVHELLDSKSGDQRQDLVKYFLVDCRPAEQYNAGHLPSAYFLDAALLMSSPGEEFQTSVDALLITQQQALESHSKSAGEHICFLGSGSEEEDRLVNMVVAQFLRRVTKYVSMVFGGYKVIHEVLGPHCDSFLTNHDVTKCQGCLCADNGCLNVNFDQKAMIVEIGSEKSMGKFLNKFSSALKTNSNKFKEKVVGYVKNAEIETKSGAKYPAYRNTGNVFSIKDDGDDDDSVQNDCLTSSPEMINLDLWSKKPDVLKTFECYVVDDDGTLNPGSLLLTKTNLFVLKKSVSSSKLDKGGLLGMMTSPVLQNMVTIHRRRTLSRVVKITSKKKMPECLTFHYLVNDDDSSVERDRYVLEEAGDAARIIKIQIQKVLDESDIRE